jgi:hypothetical protein
MKLIEKANQYRANNGQITDGFVVCFDGKVSGWTSGLKTPESWTPGCIAVGVDGKCYEAIGGDGYNGATSWKLCADARSSK